MRRHERGGGARVETGSAAAAAIRLEGEVGVEPGVGEDDTDERKRADLGANEHGILADPAEARSLRELALGDRPRIHVAAGGRAGHDLVHSAGELLETTAQDAVIVGGPGVLGDLGVPAFPRLAPGVSVPMEIVCQRHNRDARVRENAGRVVPSLGLTLEIGHVARVPRGQPAR